MSTERRQEFVKITKKLAEDGRVAVRHVRRDAMEFLKKAKRPAVSAKKNWKARKKKSKS